MSCEFRIMDFNYVWQPGTDLSASSSDASFPVSNLKDQIRGSTWRSTSVDDQSVVIDIKTIEAIDSVVLVFDPMIGIKLTEGVDLRIQANATNNWSSPAVNQTLTIDNNYSIASHYFATDQSYRYWRVFIDDPSNGYGYIELSNIILTKATQLTQNPNNGFGVKRLDRSKALSTEYGHQYNDIYPTLKAFTFDYDVLTESDIETLNLVFERVGSVRCIAVDLDSQAEVFDKDRFFIYGKFKSELNDKHKVFSYFDSGFTVEETL